MRLRLAAVVACVVGRAGQARLLVSTLLYEQQAYMDDAVSNLVAFTLPTTTIVVHVSRSATLDAAAWPARRVLVNPSREETCSSCGMVTRQHAANVRFAAFEALVDFSHVALFASSCRLFSGGGVLERHVARHNFSDIQEGRGWAKAAIVGCERGMAKSKVEPCARAWATGYGGDWFDAASLFGDALGAGGAWKRDTERYARTHAMAFSTHEGSFYPRAAAVAFAAWLFDESALGDVETARTVHVAPHMGIALEELLWPTFTLARKGVLGYDAATAGASLDVHGGSVDLVNDAQTAKTVLALRLGRDRAHCAAPASFKPWNCLGRNSAPEGDPARNCPVSAQLLACLAKADAGARAPARQIDQRRVLDCARGQADFFFADEAAVIPVNTKFLNQPECEIVRAADGQPFARGDPILDLAVEVDVWLSGGDLSRNESRAALLAQAARDAAG